MTGETSYSMEFIWRRLEEPAEWFGQVLDLEPRWWLGIGLPVLVVAGLLVLRGYAREGRTIGRGWAGLLAGLRVLVYVVLFIVWLLPAMRPVETSQQPSRVLLLCDVSASMQVTDEPPPEPGEPVPSTRQEHVIELLQGAPSHKPSTSTGSTGSGAPQPVAVARLAGPAVSATAAAGGATPGAGEDLLGEILPRNPVFVYRFGEVLDPQAWPITAQSRPTRSAWTEFLQPLPSPGLEQLIPRPLLSELTKLQRRLPDDDEAGGQNRRQAVADDLERWIMEDQQLRQRLLARTRLGPAVRDLLRKESAANVQGLIVVSDGRVTAGADQDLDEAISVARKERIPIFVIGVGRPDPLPNLRLVDILAPTRILPDDPFPVRVSVEGEAVPAGQQTTVELTVERPKGAPLTLRQAVTLVPTTGPASRGVAEFRLENPEKLKGDWKLTARVVPLPGERSRWDNRGTEPVIVKVDESKLNVLLFSSGPSREYQFLRSLLTREPDKFDLTVCLQSAQPGTVQDVDPKRLLDRFPTELRPPDEDPNNLGRYDVVIAIDPDWKQVPAVGVGEKPSPQANLRQWVEQFGGGLVVVAGPVNTFSLARSREFTDVLHLYPVLFDDSVNAFEVLDKPAKEPWALNWDPTATNQPFLNLTDTADVRQWLEGWEEFFAVRRSPETGQAEGPARRGFFSCFPLRSAKDGATVLARFSDPDRKTAAGQRQPFMVLARVGKGPVLYLGSGETYRLRQFNEKFHEVFWTKLIRQVGKRETARGLMVVGNRYAEGETVSVEVELVDAALQPLSRSENVLDLTLRLRDLNAEGQPILREFWEEAALLAAMRVLSRDRPLTREAAAAALDQLKRSGGDWQRDPRWLEAPELRGPAGKFLFRFPAPKAGSYRLELKVPGASDLLQAPFRVEAPDPELDDPRPDFAALYRLASPATDATVRESAKRPGLLAALKQSRQRLLGDAVAPTPGGSTADGERLLFTLDNAAWIAECLDANPITFRTEGRPQDLWDKGLNVFWHLHDPKQASGPPWPLVVVVLLLGTEWLTRKLLRLA